MNWITKHYPVGSVIPAPHPATGKVEYATVINHTVGTLPARVEGVVVAHPDGTEQEISAAHLAEDGSDCVTRAVSTISEVATELGIPYSNLAEMVRLGKVPARKSGRTWLVTRSAVERVLQP